MIAKTTLGTQTEIKGDHPALIAKVEDIVWKRIYEKLNAKPAAMAVPIPPFLF